MFLAGLFLRDLQRLRRVPLQGRSEQGQGEHRTVVPPHRLLQQRPRLPQRGQQDVPRLFPDESDRQHSDSGFHYS